MRLVLMRHGATAGNAERRYVGRRTDEPLSEAGRAQCLRVGTDKNVRTVYTSPLLRARQTAELCFPVARQVVVDGLAEMDFGAFEGRNAQEMEADAAYRAWVDGNCEGPCPGGESLEEFSQRSNAALVRILHDAKERGEGRVVIVAHGGTAMAALFAFACPQERRPNYFDWHLGNGEFFSARVNVGEQGVMLSHIAKHDRLS